jgi:hypothetical protein
MSAFPPLSGNEQTSGEHAKMTASGPKAFSICHPSRLHFGPSGAPGGTVRRPFVLTKAQMSACGEKAEIFCSMVPRPCTRPRHTMHTTKTQSVAQPQRNRCLLSPITYDGHYGRAAWIDPVVLRAITISWNNIIIPRSWPHHGHPDEKPLSWFTNDFGLLRTGCGTKRPRVAQHQGRSESERYGHYPHASASLPQRQINEHRS